MNTRFADKLALVGGGTGALGRVLSLAFLEEGAEVIVTYRDEQELSALKRVAARYAARLKEHQVDVTDEVAVQRLFDGIAAHGRPLDVLVNTVGGYAGGLKLWETDTRVFEQMLSLNLRSGYVLSRAAAKAMLQQRRGVIVNVASKAAVEHGPGAARLCGIQGRRGGHHGLAGC